MNLEEISTAELVNELSQREGVDAKTIEPYDIEKLTVEGPAIALIVIE